MNQTSDIAGPDLVLRRVSASRLCVLVRDSRRMLFVEPPRGTIDRAVLAGGASVFAINFAASVPYEFGYQAQDRHALYSLADGRLICSAVGKLLAMTPDAGRAVLRIDTQHFETAPCASGAGVTPPAGWMAGVVWTTDQPPGQPEPHERGSFVYPSGQHRAVSPERLTGARSETADLLFAAGDRFVARLGRDGVLRIYDLDHSGREAAAVRGVRAIVRGNPEHAFLVALDDGLYALDHGSGWRPARRVGFSPRFGGGLGLAASPDGNTLIAIGNRGGVGLIDGRGQWRELPGTPLARFVPAGARLKGVLAMENAALALVDLRPTAPEAHDLHLVRIDLSASSGGAVREAYQGGGDGFLLSTANRAGYAIIMIAGSVTLTDPQTLRPVRFIESSMIERLAAYGAGYSAIGPQGDPIRIRLYDEGRGRTIGAFSIPSRAERLAISGDGRWLAVAGADTTVSLFAIGAPLTRAGYCVEGITPSRGFNLGGRSRRLGEVQRLNDYARGRLQGYELCPCLEPPAFSPRRLGDLLASWVRGSGEDARTFLCRRRMGAS